jgi:hypothetical protein
MSKTESWFLALSLGGCKLTCNLDQVVQLANKLHLLEKICFDDVNFIPSVGGGVFQNSHLEEVSLCIACFSNLEEIRAEITLPSTEYYSVKCRVPPNPDMDLHSLLLSQSWLYACHYLLGQRVDPILEAIAGNDSIQHLIPRMPSVC